MELPVKVSCVVHKKYISVAVGWGSLLLFCYVRPSGRTTTSVDLRVTGLVVSLFYSTQDMTTSDSHTCRLSSCKNKSPDSRDAASYEQLQWYIQCHKFITCNYELEKLQH